MARILGFHPRGPGSIPGVGDHFFKRHIQHFIEIVQSTKTSIYGTQGIPSDFRLSKVGKQHIAPSTSFLFLPFKNWQIPGCHTLEISLKLVIYCEF